MVKVELRQFEPGAMPPAAKNDRPRTLGEARAQIREVFEVNGWGESEKRYYLAALGISGSGPETLSAVETRIVVADMEKTRMILFKG
jgi:hypothetical protein